MSRFRRMAHNVASSYVALAAASLFSLATVPVALHYLGAESGRFALWLLMSTIMGYMSLVDLGMSGSVARLLVDYKDHRDGGEYGSLIKTGWLVLLVQAGLIALAGFSLAPVLAQLLQIEFGLRGEFIELLRWQSGAVALSFGLRIFSHVLGAHQRADIQNYAQIAGFLVNFGLLWWFFHRGHGVFSLAWAALLTNLFNGLICGLAGWRLRFYPSVGAWGKVCRKRFRELFQYGQAMFLVALGTQMIMASQILIIQRTMGEAAATLWGLGTRMFTLISTIIWCISDVASPAFSEMIVRGERQLLQSRFKEVVILTASLSGFCAVGFALCNSDFVRVWTHGRIDWVPINNYGLAFWMMVLAVLHCHNGFVLLTKKVGFMRYVYFLEGLVFLAVAHTVAHSGGILAIIGVSIGCSCLFSGAYGIWRTVNYFALSWREVLLKWSMPMVKTFALCALAAGVIWLATRQIESTLWRLLLHFLLFSICGAVVLLRYGLPPNFQKELSVRAPRVTLPLLRRILDTI